MNAYVQDNFVTSVFRLEMIFYSRNSLLCNIIIKVRIYMQRILRRYNNQEYLAKYKTRGPKYSTTIRHKSTFLKPSLLACKPIIITKFPLFSFFWFSTKKGIFRETKGRHVPKIKTQTFRYSSKYVLK